MIEKLPRLRFDPKDEYTTPSVEVMLDIVAKINELIEENRRLTEKIDDLKEELRETKNDQWF